MIRSHIFKNGRYWINEAGSIDGMCDVPNENTGEPRYSMVILSGNTKKALNSAIHEAMHTEGIPDKYIHDKEGYSDTERISDFLWRLGWRRDGKV